MTTITDLPAFSKAHKRQRSYQPCPAETIAKYRGRLPDVLVDSWQEHGFQEFSDGFLWTVNPDDYRDVIANFVHGYQIDDLDVILRTGLGDMIVSHKGKLFYFSVVTMVSMPLPDSLEPVLGLHLSQPALVNGIFFLSMYKKALKRLGPPAEDEVYALVPAPAIGGEVAADHLQKAKLRVYLDYLAQLQSRED
ncbi:GAD-like domain-containing protein [Duganella sp. HH101]|uniref:GAD-like domain-containing protein n=1 Tax=Duganella sp. HH101 TaxID=1781066 RepID=UPI0008751713|nr:GAD-like domain-containing protein [Duganella sp. HH101]OFA06902.1 GAD-like domain protein [Duganella sp. HH101]